MTKEEKKRRVIELLQKGANIREISKRVRMSFTDIGKISRKVSGYPKPAESSAVYSKHSQALELFRKGESHLDVAITLGLTYLETVEEQKQYRRLIADDRFCQFYDARKGDFEPYILLHEELANANVTVKDAIEGARYAKHLNYMKLEHDLLVNDLQRLKKERLYFCIELEELR